MAGVSATVVHLIAAGVLVAAGCAAPPDGTRAAAPPDPWAEARQRGIDFRAVGQEPGWFIEIDHDGTMRLVWDYMDRSLTRESPPPGVDGRLVTYVSDHQSPRVRVRAEQKTCYDSMSGAAYPMDVTVTIDDRELRGCGRRWE